MSDSLAERFNSVFKGLDRAYGTYTISATKSNGKRTGQATMPRAPVTVELWQEHLDGKQGIGIVPIRDDATCLFGAIDIDSYDITLVKVVQQFEEAGLPFVVCRSKSGGAHCFLFCSSPVSAIEMRERLKEVVDFLGLPPTTEIFPKQERLSSQQDCGSFINAPYHDGLKGMRFAIRPNGDAMTPEEFLDFVETRRVTPEWFEAELLLSAPEPKTSPGQGVASDDGSYCSDGPPCLQLISIQGTAEGTRNEILTNFARYAKRRYGKDWKREVANYNERVCQPPVEHSELELICHSVGKKDYYYSCKAPCLAEHCNATLCRTRKYGILPAGGADGVGKFSGLRKLMTDPPIFFLDVDKGEGGVITMELTGEQLQSPRLFQRRCIETAGIVPPIPKQEDWGRILADWLNRVVEMPAPADASLEGQLLEYLDRFCTSRVRGINAEELLIGKPWINEAGVTFRLQDFLKFLKINQFRDFQPNKVAAVLQKAKGTHGHTRVRGKDIMTWTVPLFGEMVEGVAVPEGVEERKLF